MDISRNAKYLVAALTISLSVIAGNTQAGLVTWTLGQTTFSFGETARGYFTVDQEEETVVAWNITIARGTNPNIPDITFSDDSDTGCLIWCGRLFPPSPVVGAGAMLDFRTPLAADSTIYELLLVVAEPLDALLFPSKTELQLTQFSDIRYEQFIPPDTLSCPPNCRSTLQNGSIVTTQVIPEPATLALLGLGLAGLGFSQRKQ